MNARCILSAGLAAVMLSGCGIAYGIKRDEMLRNATEADFGPRPPANHEETEKNLVLERLKDPESARFKSVDKIKNTAIQTGFASPTPVLVWITAIGVNAKNGYGGYTGFQYYGFAWKDNKVIAISSPAESLDGAVYWNYIE